ncbi:formate hydrogenlyase [Dehalobacter sp. DCM]|uniref:proton-conducting transporter transmembrane domain-containing protein n=1 Tax=Dehalobacter sp. DCM TaxID=2907827 RepID=UPI0030821565|nr:formate hydrogenlyase [Dehalobacter sp. DCM]
MSFNLSAYAVLFLQLSLMLYLLGAATALIAMFKREQKAANGLVNLFCIAASVLTAVASVSIILNRTGKLIIFDWQSVLPFINLQISIDNLSALFLLALSVLVFCVSIYSISYIDHYRGKRNIGLFYLLYVLFIVTMFLVLTASNAVIFYMSWEAMSLLSYFLVVFETEKEENQKAGTLYIVMTHLATALLLVGIAIIYNYTQSFEIMNTSTAGAIPTAAKNAAFLLFLVGFGTKAGVIPFHIWLPYAHPAAPSNVSALMSGIMIKTAIYGLIRFVLCLLGIENTWWGVLILVLGIISAVLGVAYALMEHNIKRLLAFHSVENIGIILIGLGVSYIALAQHNAMIGGFALIAALLHTVNHALFKGGLFLGAGAIQYAVHTKDIEKLGGLLKRMPVTGLLILCFSLAISAIVPFNGFISEWLTFQSLFANIVPGQIGLNFLSIVAVAALALTGALAAACFVKLFSISFLGLPRSEEASSASEVPKTMTAGMAVLAVICFGIGLFPMIIIRILDPVVVSLGGGSIFGQLQGGFIMAYYPLTVQAGSISPIALLLALGGIFLLTLGVLRIVGGKYVERKYGTWDCGFDALNARMQYTATGFSKPIKIVFRILFRPTRKTLLEGDSFYYPDSIEYTTTVASIFEDYLYHPVIKLFERFSKRTKFRIQTGSIHSYLLYIFVAVLVLMLYNRFA